MKIGEVSQIAGIPASTLRYYENEGLIAKPVRVSGIRFYERSVLDNLTIIAIAKAAGFSVAEIHRLLRGFSGKTPPGKRWRALAEKKLNEVEDRIDQLHRMKIVLNTVLGCECPSFDDCAKASRSHES